MIYAAEESASCRIYPVLKRPDERWITMEAYESIHGHDAFAETSWSRA